MTLSGNVPSQKNRKIISVNRATGARFLRSAPAVKEWQEQAIMMLKLQFKGLKTTDYPINISMVFYFGDNRRRDLDNALSTVMDALVAAEVIEDDDNKHVECITIQYGGLDIVNPRVEIFFDE